MSTYKFNPLLKGLQDGERALAAIQMIGNGTIKERAYAMTGATASTVAYMTKLGVTSAAELTFAQKLRLSTMALWEQAAAWAASPLGMATIAAAGIFAIVKAVDWMTVSVEESREALAELGEEFKENQSKLQELNGELETTADRISELDSKGTLTFTEAEELQNLKKQNNELEREIALLETMQRIKSQERNAAFVETMEKDLENAKEYLRSHDYSSSNYSAIYTDTKKYGKGRSVRTMSEMDLINSALMRRAEIIEALSGELTEKERTQLETLQYDIDNYLTDKLTELNNDVESSGVGYISNPTTEDEKAVNEWLSFIDDFNDKMMIAMGATGAKENAVNRLILGDYAEVTKGLQEIGRQGTVTADHLADPKYDDFINKCIELGIISDDGTNSLSFLALAFNTVASAAGGASNNIKDAAEQLKTEIDTINDGIDGVQSRISTLSDALTKLHDGSLDLNDVIDLLQQFPELAPYVDITAEGFGNLGRGLQDLIKASPNDLIESLQQFKETRELTEDQKSQIDNLCDALRSLPTDAIEDVADSFNHTKTKVLELVAAYSKWKTIQSGPESGDIYDDSIQALQQILDGLESGKVGTDKYKASVEFLVPEANRSDVSAYVESLKRYISEDASGVSNFISDSITAGLMVDDGSGHISIISDATVQDFCDKLKITPDMAQAIFGELEEYGWNLNWNVDDFVNPEADTTQTDGGLDDVQKTLDGIADTTDTVSAKIIGDLGASETVVSLKEVIKWMDEIDSHQPSDKHVNVYTHTISDDEGGQSSANGTKSAAGGRTLVGELGAELVVSGGRYYLVGQNGAEFVNLKSGDMVFNHVDTKKIMDGRKGVRGQALAAGTMGSGVRYNMVSIKDDGGIYIGVPVVGGGDPPHITPSPNPQYNGTTSQGGKSDEESWFEKQLKEHQHLVEMDKESQEDYLNWLDDAYKRAYEEGIVDLDDFYKYEEEIYKGRQDLFKDHLNDIDHDISILEAGVGNSNEIINLSLQAIQAIEAELAAARSAGLDENDDYIQWLEQQWSNYSQTVIDLREDAEAEAKSSIEDLVEYRIKMLKQEIENEKDALNQKLDDLQVFYDKQRQMLQDQYDEEKYLEEQKEKRKSVTDIRSDLAMLDNDDSAWAQKRKLELQEQLADAEKELSSFERDHALDMTLDALEQQQATQEAEIQAQMDALDAKLNDPHALFNQALEDIKNNTAELYREFINYNRKYDTGNDQDIVDMWTDAYKADLEYQNTHNGQHLNGIAIGNYVGYRSGTSYSIGGLARFDEEGKGSEYIFESSDGNRYRMFSEGSKVLNADATNFLYNFATSGGGIIMKALSDLFGISSLGNISKPMQAVEIHSGDIIVQGNATERTVSEIRRAQRENLKFVITEFNKLNK